MDLTSRLRHKFEDAKSNGAYIYGEGSFSARITQILQSIGIEILGYINNLQIEETSILRSTSTENKKQVVFLGFNNYVANIYEITKFLDSNNFSIINPVEIAQITNYFGIDFENYWLTNRFELYVVNSSEIEVAAKLFKEDKSSSLYRSIIAFRQSGDISHLSKKDTLENQYFPEDFDWITSPRFITKKWDVLDGGAFQGESYEAAVSKIEISNWKFVEPDLNNIVQINNKYGDTNLKSSIIAKALYDKCGIASFSHGVTTFGSRISDTGNNKIETTTIDCIYRNGEENVDFIKLDVEGSEIEALIGGIQTIWARKPFLAIAIYHKPEDHWKIPIFISKRFPFYDLYLRLHGEQSFDTVLYCKPRENS